LLAGEAVGGLINNVKIENGSIITARPGLGAWMIGGLIGKGIDLQLKNIFADVQVNGEFSDSPEGPGYSAINFSQASSVPETSGPVKAVGGLAGYLNNSTVKHSNTTVKIDISTAAGGLVGFAVSTSFCSSGTDSGVVKGKNTVGGFAGRLEGRGTVLECHSHAEVIGEVAGGFVGQISGSRLSANANHTFEVDRCHATGKTLSSAGGIAGGFAGKGEYVLIKDSSAYGDVRGYAGAGGFAGQLSNLSRIIHAYAKGDVFLDGQQAARHSSETTGFAGGFIGELANSACVEFSYAAGAVITGETSERAAAGGFVGVISAHGAPNTITHCLSFAPWVVGDGYVHRFAGRTDHDGVNGCYAFLGSMVVNNGSLTHILPSAYGPDGADMSHAQVDEIVKRLGWRRPILFE